ncbi:MAG: protein kinase [Acidobacteriota bacterium]
MKRIGKYEIISEIGRGGFGRVYKAIDPSMSRYVAIKVLEMFDQPEMLIRFRNEAAAGGNLRHRNITTIYDFGDHAGIPYLVMEFLDGQDLDQLMFDGRTIPMAQRLDILIQAAEGLQCAHQNGIIHRDVKPANIMVLNDGTVKLMDFGIARITQGNASVHTRTGVLVGTVRYMAPEQFEGLNADQRVDIWAWGVIGWELLSGEHPFDAGDPANVMYRITTSDLSDREVHWPDCPPGLTAVLKRAVCRQRNQRIATFEDILFELKPVQRDLQRMRASQIIADARTKLNTGQTQEAQRLLRHVLELDADHPELAEVRSRVQAELSKQRTSEEVTSLVARADQAYSARNFEEAIGCLESAQQMAPEDRAIRSRLEVARAIQQRFLKSQSLLAEARRALGSKNYSGAFNFASEASQADPANEEARGMMASVQESMKERQVEGEVAAGLERVRQLLAVQEFAEAIQIAEGLARDYGARPELQQVVDQAKAEQLESQTRIGIDRILDSARAALDAEQPDKAVELLEELTRRYPAAYLQAEPLLASARQRIKAAAREADVSGLLHQASELVGQEKFEKAKEVLKKGLLHWPDDAELARALNDINRAKVQRDRERLVHKALEKGEQLRKRGRFKEAIEYLDRVMPELGISPDLSTLRQLIATEASERDAFAATSKSRVEVPEAPPPPPPVPVTDTATQILTGLTSSPAPTPPPPPPVPQPAWRPAEIRQPLATESPIRKHWPWMALAGVAVVSLAVWLGLRGPANSPPPTIQLVAPTSPLRYHFDAGSALILSKPLSLQTDGGKLDVAIEGETPGIEPAVRKATAPGDVTIRVHKDQFTPGVHTAAVLVKAGGQEQRYPIEIEVEAPAANGKPGSTVEPQRAALLVDQSTIQWRGNRGMPLQTVTVKVGSSTSRLPFRVSVSGSESEWLKVSPQAGTAPSTIQLALRRWPSPGRYAADVRIAPAASGPVPATVQVELVVDAASPPQPKPEPVVAPSRTQTSQVPAHPPVQVPSQTPAPVATQVPVTRPPAPPALYGGRTSGRLTWTGSLGPGEAIVVNRDGLVAGPGAAAGTGPPSVVPTQVVDVSPPEARYSVAPFENNPAGRIEIRNSGASAITFIQVRWRVNLP